MSSLQKKKKIRKHANRPKPQFEETKQDLETGIWYGRDIVIQLGV